MASDGTLAVVCVYVCTWSRWLQILIHESGAIAPLVAMLNSPSAEMCTNAAGALSTLSRDNVDNQAAIARTGAIAPLCTLVREGSPETKEQSASALWSLSLDNAPNKVRASFKPVQHPGDCEDITQP